MRLEAPLTIGYMYSSCPLKLQLKRFVTVMLLGQVSLWTSTVWRSHVAPKVQEEVENTLE